MPSWRQRLQLLDVFEQAWERGERPSVESALPASSSSRSALLVNLILVEQEYRLRSGEAVRAEEYFARFPELAHDADDALEIILAERLARQQRGEELSSAEFLKRFPQYQAELAIRLDDAATSLGSDATERPDASARCGDLPERVGRYRVDSEIARGGMGKVVRVHDETFQRPLALKVLIGLDPAEPSLVERFLREARLTAQLQHPGIPPVQEMGRLPDGRPYFIMKLIKGHSLAALLRERPSPSHDLPRFLSIFEQICQTLAYAHDRRVLHRDLKPGNIMVGAFGEVQVMDWGLAKVMGDDKQPSASQMEAEALSVAGSVSPSSSDDGKTAAGAVLGTPAYMAPEQARGEIENLDPRCDVFGLGGILCDILTGKAPFAAPSAGEAHRLAMKGDLSAAHARLDACGADHELLDIGRRCLAPETADRFASAADVAKAVGKYQVDLQDRLRQAEIDRAAAEVQAREEKKRRHVWMALAAAVLILVSGAGSAWIWYQQDQAARLAEELQRQAEADRSQALADKGIGEALGQASKARTELQVELERPGGVVQLLNEPARWLGHINAARAALDRATALQPETSSQERWIERIQELARQTRQDDADRRLAQRLEQIRLERSMLFEGKMNLALAEREYPLAFASFGFHPEPGNEKDMARLIRESPIKEQLLAALDDWTFAIGLSREEKRELLERLSHIARQADPDAWAATLRDPSLWRKPRALKSLADKALKDPAVFARLSPQTLYLMARRLDGQKGLDETWLRRGQSLHPADFWLNFQLGVLLIKRKPAAAEGFFRAAIAVRKESAAAWYNLGNALRGQEQVTAAIAAYRRSLDIAPNTPLAWTALVALLNRQKDAAGALAAYQKALALDPRLIVAWYNLAVLRSNQKDQAGAIQAYEIIIRELNPKHAMAWNGLAGALRQQGDWPAATQAYEKAVECDATFANAWLGVGSGRYHARDYAAALAAFEKAVALDPASAIGWYNLGVIRGFRKDLPAAITAYRNAVAAQPDHADAQRELVLTCRKLGRFAEAVQCGKAALAVLPASAPQRTAIARQVTECQKLLDLDKRMAEVLRGSKASTREQIALAEYCLRDKRDYSQAVHFYGVVFGADPKLADAILGHRYHAARAALLAAGREGKSDAAEKARLRRQALDWLRADVGQWQELIAARKPIDTLQATFWMRSWLESADLADVRDSSKLPEAEQPPWRNLWSDVAALVKQARARFVQTQFKGTLTKSEPERAHEANLVAGRTYVFEMQSQQVDAWLRLEDSHGKKLLENDDISPDNKNARILFIPQKSGTYRLVATAHPVNDSGAYTLFIFTFAAGEAGR